MFLSIFILFLHSRFSLRVNTPYCMTLHHRSNKSCLHSSFRARRLSWLLWRTACLPLKLISLWKLLLMLVRLCLQNCFWLVFIKLILLVKRVSKTRLRFCLLHLKLIMEKLEYVVRMKEMKRMNVGEHFRKVLSVRLFELDSKLSRFLHLNEVEMTIDS